MKPGEYYLESQDVIANQGRKTVKLLVKNSGDRPIQVGSHFHCFETNKGLIFDREKSLGMRLNVASGTAIRFEPGQSHEVELVEIAGDKIIHGFNNLVEGNLNDKAIVSAALANVEGFTGDE